MMKIWGRTNSSNVKKVLWVAEELSLAYERVDAGGAFGIVNEPAYRALNPNGLVPTVEDDGLVLWESHAIVRYLSAKYGPEKFGPADIGARASADKWMDWASGVFSPHFRDVFWTMVRTPPEQRDMAKVEAGVMAAVKVLQMVEATLAKQPYLSGEACGIGDVPLGSSIYAWFSMDIERPTMPALEAWYDRLTRRPTYRKAVMIPLT